MQVNGWFRQVFLNSRKGLNYQRTVPLSALQWRAQSTWSGRDMMAKLPTCGSTMTMSLPKPDPGLTEFTESGMQFCSHFEARTPIKLRMPGPQFPSHHTLSSGSHLQVDRFWQLQDNLYIFGISHVVSTSSDGGPQQSTETSWSNPQPSSWWGKVGPFLGHQMHPHTWLRTRPCLGLGFT